MGNKLLEEFFASSALTRSINSRYDPTTNHCYGELVTHNVSGEYYFSRDLVDLQTGELLASAKIEKGKKFGLLRGVDLRDDPGFSDANEYINEIMQEDR